MGKLLLTGWNTSNIKLDFAENIPYKPPKKLKKLRLLTTKLEKIIDEEVTRTVNDLNSNPTTKPLISIEPEPLKAFLAEKVKDRADAIFDDALLLEIRNRVKAQINKALMEDFEEFQKKQVEVLRQHIQGDNTTADLDGTGNC